MLVNTTYNVVCRYFAIHLVLFLGGCVTYYVPPTSQVKEIAHIFPKLEDGEYFNMYVFNEPLTCSERTMVNFSEYNGYVVPLDARGEVSLGLLFRKNFSFCKMVVSFQPQVGASYSIRYLTGTMEDRDVCYPILSREEGGVEIQLSQSDPENYRKRNASRFWQDITPACELE